MFEVDSMKCTGCGICVRSCPVEAIFVVDGKARIDNDKCTDCGNCLEVCPLNAIYSDADFNTKMRQDFSPSPGQESTGFGGGIGMGRGLGKGKGRGLGRGPRDGRGGGRGGGGRRW
jgi:NAD-dependent dihydropyrimidine dehydrogenase PreA subunit